MDFLDAWVNAEGEKAADYVESMVLALLVVCRARSVLNYRPGGKKLYVVKPTHTPLLTRKTCDWKSLISKRLAGCNVSSAWKECKRGGRLGV